MDFKTYQRLAVRTLQCNMTEEQLASNLALGICGEAGEIADYLKKVIYHKHDLDYEKLENELGDQLWYLSMLAETFGLSMADIAQKNIDKLKARYPNGFSYEDSRNRTDDRANDNF